MRTQQQPPQSPHSPRAPRRVCVFAGSRPGARADYTTAARELGATLAVRGIGLVYGGASVGLMGTLADAALDGGGEVIGVIPHALARREITHRTLAELHMVDTMHQRKALMYNLADAFVVGPGGLGTLEEAFETLTGIQLGYHRKPIVFLDVDGFWSPMEQFLDHAVDAAVLRPEYRTLFRTSSTARGALDLLAAW